MTVPDGVLDLVQRWAAAEQGNDAGTLGGLLADDFAGVGPLGFVLTREQWLARFGHGLVNHAFAIEDPQVHGYAAAAVVIGVLAQETSWQGGDNSGRFRVSLVAVWPGGPLGARQRPHRPPADAALPARCQVTSAPTAPGPSPGADQVSPKGAMGLGRGPLGTGER